MLEILILLSKKQTFVIFLIGAAIIRMMHELI